jgi:hypothetical protein
VETLGSAISMSNGGQCSIFAPIMDPAFALTVSDLALDDLVRLRCDCRARAYSRAELGALVRLGARLHLIGLHRELWCRECGEPPFHGWVTIVIPSHV